MQQVELWLIVGAVLAVVVLWAMRSRTVMARHPLLLGALLGIVPGILGAIVVLVPRTDLVPDATEPYAWVLIGLIASGAAILALTIGVVRR